MSRKARTEPDHILVSASSLKLVFVMLSAAENHRVAGRVTKAFHTQQTAVGHLRNLLDGAVPLKVLLQSVIDHAPLNSGASA